MGAVSDRFAAKRRERARPKPHGAGGTAAPASPEAASPRTPQADARCAPDPTRIVFLDVMGTLNSHAFRMKHHEDRAEPAKCAIVNAIVAATGARIVVSSSVRTNASCRGDLMAAGLEDAFHQDWRTPEVPDAWTRPLRRSREIGAWLDAHPGTAAYAILDDDVAQIGREHRRRLVPVERVQGLQPYALDFATSLLDKTLGEDDGGAAPTARGA